MTIDNLTHALSRRAYEMNNRMNAITVANPLYFFARSSQTYSEHRHWLFPIEDRRDQNGHGLAGLMRGVSLAGYLHLVDWSSRLIRPGKANLSSTVPDILTRLGIDTDCWKETLQRLLDPNKKIGSYFGSTSRLSEVATQRGCKYIKNFSGRDIPLHAPGNSSPS